MATGDAAFISISRYMLDHWRDSAWWPIWYNGIPGHDAYPPLLHAIVALLAGVERVSPALAHHQFACIVYALAPVSIFFLVERLSASTRIALAVALTFSLFSPSTILMPWVRISGVSWFGPWRLCVLAAYGDAPHMFGFALIPFAIVALDSALRRRRPVHYLVTALLMAAILLTNWLGTVALACTVVSLLLATSETSKDLSRWIHSVLIAAVAYLLACPWIPPSTLRVIASGGQVDQDDFRADMRHLPGRAFLVVVLLVVVKLALRGGKASRGIQFGVFLLVLPGAFPLLYQYARIALVPMPWRYEWEMDLAVCMLIVMAGAVFLRRFPRQVTWAVAAVALAAGLWFVRAYRQYAVALIHPVDMTTTIEYKTAAWLKNNYPTSRVFAIGTVSYWLNNYADVPQVSGGFDPGTPTEVNRVALKTIEQTDNPAATLLWLRAFGADLAVVGGPHTRAPFNVYRAPEKFDQIAQKVWSDGDDFIYLIPRRSRSLAQVVRQGDTGDIGRYVAALEDPSLPTAAFAWRDGHSAVVSGTIPRSDVLSIQVTYNPGWHATVDGSPRRITKDAMGLMTIDPMCAGPCSVVLNYDGGLESLITRSVAAMTLAMLGVLSVVGLVKKRAARTAPAAVVVGRV